MQTEGESAMRRDGSSGDKSSKECDVCGKQKPDVILRIDPFMEEIHDQRVVRMLCKACYDDLAMDV